MFRSSLTLSLLFFSFFCLLNWNCTKIDNTSIGADLLPAVDNVNTFDTLVNVIANNFDTASKECFVIFPQNDHSLGYIKNNPLFGTTNSILYTQLGPNVFPFNFPANRTLDSIVLVLSYRSTFGDTAVAQKVNVHLIANEFIPDTSSCRFYAYEPAVLGSAIYIPQQLKDSVIGFKERTAGQLRIRLSNTFGESLLLKDSSNAFKSDSLFRDFLKGFAIVPDVNYGGNALNYFNLADTNTKLAVYLKSTINTTIDTAVYNFRLSNYSYSANYVVRDHTGAEIINHLAQLPDGDDAVYIQTTPGTYAEIRFPDLSKLSNRIIHRAVLTMDQVYSNNKLENIFSAPDILYLDMKDTSLSNPFKPIPCDLTIFSGVPNITTFGGTRTTVKDQAGNNISRYTFNLSRYLQKIVTNGQINATLRLRAPDNIFNPTGYFDACGQGVSPFYYPLLLPAFGQVKLGGGKNVNYKMKLHIIYSNI
ncbi:MAG: DUF4270 family protein [Ginsengibacter sp.]